MKIEVIERGRALPRAEGQAVLLGVSRRMRAKDEARPRVARLLDAPDRPSVAKAMLAVEARLVKAFWTIARLPGERLGGNGRCGLDYIPERGDLAGYTDAAGKNWESIAPRPARPSAKDIDDAKSVIEWLLLIEDERLRRILVVGATSKRGTVKRGISWTRLRPALGESGATPERTLRFKYAQALRVIVTEMTLARIGE